jgi:hypothetical protein
VAKELVQRDGTGLWQGQESILGHPALIPAPCLCNPGPPVMQAVCPAHAVEVRDERQVEMWPQ